MLRVPSLISIKGFLILDANGRRVLAFYYDEELKGRSKDLERRLFKKTVKTNVEILLMDGMIVCYKPSVDLYFYVFGASYENEVMLQSVLNCYYDSLNIILRKEVEKRILFQNLRIVLLALDEICDKGVILEVDPHTVARRVTLKSEEIPIGEQTVNRVLSLLTRNN